MTIPYVPLEELMQGRHGTIRHLSGGQTFVGRLAALGLTPGTELKVLQNLRHGPVLILVRDTRIALGRGEARKILVEESVDERTSTDG
jgi:ferrous iron transport protein A